MTLPRPIILSSPTRVCELRRGRNTSRRHPPRRGGGRIAQGERNAALGKVPNLTLRPVGALRMIPKTGCSWGAKSKTCPQRCRRAPVSCRAGAAGPWDKSCPTKCGCPGSGVPTDRSSSVGWYPGSPRTGLRPWGGGPSLLGTRESTNPNRPRSNQTSLLHIITPLCRTIFSGINHPRFKMSGV